MTPALQLQQQIAAVKQLGLQQLCRQLQLYEVQAPLALPVGSGLQDQLSGSERAVAYTERASGQRFEVVHSLAKWKRALLAAQPLPAGQGIVAQMTALRPDEAVLSERHSVLVEQWDWEQVIRPEQRQLATLKHTVQGIYQALLATLEALGDPQGLLPELPPQVTFLHSEQLLQQYPGKTAKQRERAAARDHQVVFIIGIGAPLSDGLPHDGRAADYDDWSSRNSDGYQGLNGDLLVWHRGLQDALELSSMGIRVDAEALQRQLRACQQQHWLALPWHQQLVAGAMPTTIGGGIGVARVAMWMLQLSHISESQSLPVACAEYDSSVTLLS